MLTTFGRPGYLRRAMEVGASGFLLKDAPATELAVAIRRAHRGERVVDPGLAAEALSEGTSPLTEREREVLAASIEGGTNAEIAGRLECFPSSSWPAGRARSSIGSPTSATTRPAAGASG